MLRTVSRWLPQCISLLLLLCVVQDLHRLLQEVVEDHLAEIKANLGLFKLVVEPVVLVFQDLVLQLGCQLGLAQLLGGLLDQILFETKELRILESHDILGSCKVLEVNWLFILLLFKGILVCFG